MTIKLFNTINRKKEEFRPENKDKITMYVCGPTVYSHPHIGNARAALIPDILFRLLSSKYSKVIYIRNITDVDDKISEAARKSNKTVYDISSEFTKIYHTNMKSLGILNPTFEPKVTDSIPGIISAIQNILDSGYAYISEKHVLFDTVKYKNYGQLSKKNFDEMIDGARVEIASYKNSPRDFVLWKPSDSTMPGWDSPWGVGRPGWHIECTSMIKEIIGKENTLDIHGGGNDLIFPHHENEIAQGSCMSSVKYCNYWFHNGIVLVDKKKMSKSLGNVILIEDLLKNHSSISIRLALLSAHYRQPLNWTNRTITDSQNLITKFKSSIIRSSNDNFVKGRNIEFLLNPKPQQIDNEIFDILSDDLNTPEAITYLSRLSKYAKNNDEDAQKLINAASFLGINLLEPIKPKKIDENLIDQLILERNQSRSQGNYKRADEIRDKLTAMGVKIKDLDDKTTWEYISN